MWCVSVRKMSATASSTMNVAIDVLCVPEVGSNIAENESPICWAMMVPAVCSADSVNRMAEPSTSPTASSANSMGRMDWSERGSTCSPGRTSGTIIRVISSASESRTRGGTERSPIPGMSMMRVPTRAKTSSATTRNSGTSVIVTEALSRPRPSRGVKHAAGHHVSHPTRFAPPPAPCKPRARRP